MTYKLDDFDSEVEMLEKINEQQSIIRRDEMSIKIMMSNMEKLEEENKQLKQEHKIAIDEMITDYKNLEKENEQLRQFINKGRRLSVKELMANTNENELLKKKIKELEKENEDLREVNKETVKQCERWKNLYELKDAEVTARVDALNKVCEYYTSEVLFKSDVDPNKAVKEVINEILNAPIYEEG